MWIRPGVRAREGEWLAIPLMEDWPLLGVKLPVMALVPLGWLLEVPDPDSGERKRLFSDSGCVALLTLHTECCSVRLL